MQVSKKFMSFTKLLKAKIAGVEPKQAKLTVIQRKVVSKTVLTNKKKMKMI